jgi:hypothetical protein
MSKRAESIQSSPNDSSNESPMKVAPINYPKEITLSQQKDLYMKTLGLSERKPIEINSNRKLFSSGGLMSDRVNPSNIIVAKVEKRNLTVMLREKHDEAKIDYAKTL